jgi:hypothetical protein
VHGAGRGSPAGTVVHFDAVQLLAGEHLQGRA